MTCGEPNGEPQELYRAIARTQDLVDAKKFTVFPIAIGDAADVGILSKFSSNQSPLMLKGVEFREFFAWLSQSVVRVSELMPGEKMTFDMERVKNWAVLS